MRVRLIVMAVGVVVAAVSVLLVPGPARAEFAVGAGADVINDSGAPMGSLRYDYRPWLVGGEVMVWESVDVNGEDRANGALIADINLARWPVDLDFGSWSVDVGLGAAYLARTDDLAGTLWNFSVRGALNLGDRFRLFIIHISHGRDTLDIARNDPNEGWNFVGAALRF